MSNSYWQDHFYKLELKYLKLHAFVESLTMSEFDENHLKQVAVLMEASCHQPISIALRARQVLEECKNG